MSDKQLQENQQELFPGLSGEAPRPDPAPIIAKTQKPIFFSTTLEQLLLAGIISILLLCLVFYLGVLRGRSMNAAMIPAPSVVAVSPAAMPVRTLPASVKPAAPVKKESSFVVINESSVKPYTIQVLTTKKKAYAEEEASFLRKNGAGAWSAKSGDFYVVCTGSYANKEEAQKDLFYLRSRYKSAYLRRR